jgi:cytoskeleton protein RodZ
LASFAIGAKLRQERAGRGLTIDDIARNTKIAPRYLQAIEADDFSNFPGLVFTRNFVRQYALALQLDPEPLLAELPAQDESTVQLPNPPARRRSSYRSDRRLRSLASSMIWLLIAGGGGLAAYVHFNRSGQPASRQGEAASAPAAAPIPAPAALFVAGNPGEASATASISSAAAPVPALPVEVLLTAHAPAWIEVTADGKKTFMGTLQPNETRQISAAEQVNISTGNAGALTISLNGKTLDSLGTIGQVRAVRLTAEGPEPLSRVPQPVYDPL